MSMDRFPTPASVAEHLVALLSVQRKRVTVADFAAGDGRLLKIASDRLPNAQLVATDIDDLAVRKLRTGFPSWTVGKVDFLDAVARNRSQLLRSLREGVDILLLNPPYTCRGAAKTAAVVGSVHIGCSTAMAFLLTSIDYIKTDGELRVVLPASVLSSQKDQKAREVLERYAAVRVVAEFGHNTFDGCHPKTVVLHMKKKRQLSPGVEQKVDNSSEKECSVGRVEIVRGSIQMHTVNWRNYKDGIPLVHTTDLGKSTKLITARRIPGKPKVVTGPAVLLPRVGKPDVRKVVVLPSQKSVALSDCVFSLRCRSAMEAKRVYAALRAQWERVEHAFGGTGAPYLTISGLTDALAHIGIAAQPPKEIA